MTTWQEKATLQEEAISPNVLYNHTSLLPDSSMPQGINYRVWKMADMAVERHDFIKNFLKPVCIIKKSGKYIERFLKSCASHARPKKVECHFQ